MKRRISIFFTLFTLVSFGQGPDIEVEGVGTRYVEPAYRISETPKIIDTTISSKVADYPLLVIQHPTTITLQDIDAAKIKTTEKLSQLYPFYVKLGIGSELMPLGEVYFDSKRSRKFIYGAHVKHLS